MRQIIVLNRINYKNCNQEVPTATAEIYSFTNSSRRHIKMIDEYVLHLLSR